MNKNNVIYALIFAVLVASIWGSIANRKNVRLEKEVENMEAKLQQVTAQSNLEREQVLGKTARLQENLVQKETQLAAARKELVSLRKETQALEAKLSGCDATIRELRQQKKKLQQELRKIREKQGATPGKSEKKTASTGSGKMDAQAGNTAGDEKRGHNRDDNGQALRKQLGETQAAIAGLQQQFDACISEITGLEKIINKNEDAVAAGNKEMDRLKTNLDVLLSRISDLQDGLRELEEENRRLHREIADMNGEIVGLQEEVMTQPVQE